MSNAPFPEDATAGEAAAVRAIYKALGDSGPGYLDREEVAEILEALRAHAEPFRALAEDGMRVASNWKTAFTSTNEALVGALDEVKVLEMVSKAMTRTWKTAAADVKLAHRNLDVAQGVGSRLLNVIGELGRKYSSLLAQWDQQWTAVDVGAACSRFTADLKELGRDFENHSGLARWAEQREQLLEDANERAANLLAQLENARRELEALRAKASVDEFDRIADVISMGAEHSAARHEPAPANCLRLPRSGSGSRGMEAPDAMNHVKIMLPEVEVFVVTEEEFQAVLVRHLVAFGLVRAFAALKASHEHWERREAERWDWLKK